MAATKYEPEHFAGILVSDTPTIAFSPGAGVPAPLGEILTGIVVANGALAGRTLSLYYTHNSTSIYLFNQLLLPANSTTNLDLYLPLVAGQNVSCVASAANDISLTLYGLRMEAL